MGLFYAKYLRGDAVSEDENQLILCQINGYDGILITEKVYIEHMLSFRDKNTNEL